jgi:hypothetical protein
MAPAPRAPRVAIDAPNAEAAFDLERRLAHLVPTTVAHSGQWVVDVPGVTDDEELALVVQQWLERSGADATTMRVDGRPVRVRARRPRARHVPTNRDFIG